MAEIRMEQKRRRGAGWLWAVLAIVLVVLIVWWVWPERERDVELSWNVPSVELEEPRSPGSLSNILVSVNHRG